MRRGGRVKWWNWRKGTSFLTLRMSKRSHALPNEERLLLLTSPSHVKLTFLFT
jgi:hypothetical protein